MNPITLDQLVALNDEIAALVRSGVPLESGLVDLGHDMPGRTGKLATEIGRRLEAGESLAQVVSNTDGAFPPLYQAVVEAGLRSGRLPVALEGLSTSMRRVKQLRRLVGLSLVYPLAVVAVAYAMFVVTITFTTPVLAELHGELSLPGNWLVQALASMGRTSRVWWPLPPLIAIVVLMVVWYRSGQFANSTGAVSLGRVPSFRRLLRTGRLGSFAEVLKLLIEQDVPLDEAVVLAADASADRGLQQASREIAERIRRGETGGDQFASVPGFPPLLSWLMSSGTPHVQLMSALDNMSRRYHDRARGMSDWLTIYLPIVLAAGIGGAAALLLGLATLGPWFQILYELGKA